MQKRPAVLRPLHHKSLNQVHYDGGDGDQPDFILLKLLPNRSKTNYKSKPLLSFFVLF